MRMTVVIPVYNDQKSLELCLEALHTQSLPARQFEIVVVDNGSSDPVVVQGFTNARVVSEPQPGSYAARNRGIFESTCEILAFTDADCLPHQDWLKNGLDYLDEHEDVECIGGAIRVFSSQAQRRTPCEVYESVKGFPQDEYVRNRNFAATANLIARRSVFDSVGAFDASLKSGGDVEFGNRSAAAGKKMVFVDTVVVRHPARRTMREFLHKLFRTMAGARDLAASKGRPFPYPLRGTLRALFPPIPTMVRTARSSDVAGYLDRLKYMYATLVIHYCRAFFRLRLQLGAGSSR